MKLIDYIKDQWISILLFLFYLVISSLLLFAFKVSKECVYAIIFMSIVLFIVAILLGYYRKKKFYEQLINTIDSLDQKYLITEIINEPHFLEGKIIYSSLIDIDKSMLERIQVLETSIIDFKDYIEMWIHEVKLPLASLTLAIHNQPELPSSFQENVRRIENEVNQVLYYVRSENAEKDYLITKTKLSDLVREVAIYNKDDLLANHIHFSIESLNFEVNTDSKWLVFILNQIISNSIKYKKEENAKIHISARIEGNNTYLSVYDNGIGIIQQDLPRVFQKSFTGYNGRSRAKSTGMGLYIVKKLCDKLGHEVSIESKQNEYTKVEIVFHSDEYYNVL